MLDEFGTVSRDCAEMTTVSARNRTGATYALSVTGNAGSATDGSQAPVGSMWIGLADGAEVTAMNRVFPGDRERIRRLAAQIDKFGTVSRGCAEMMAVGARNRTGATYAPVGSLWIGLADGAGVMAVNHVFPGVCEHIRRLAGIS